MINTSGAVCFTFIVCLLYCACLCSNVASPRCHGLVCACAISWSYLLVRINPFMPNDTRFVCFCLAGMRIATIYAKTHLRTLLSQNVGVFCPSSEGFLMIRIQILCGKAFVRLMCLNQFLVGMMPSSAPKGLIPFNELKYQILYCPPLPRVYLTWQIAQTLMRRHVMRRFISIYATICKCSFLFFLHKCTNHITTIAYIEF